MSAGARADLSGLDVEVSDVSGMLVSSFDTGAWVCPYWMARYYGIISAPPSQPQH